MANKEESNHISWGLQNDKIRISARNQYFHSSENLKQVIQHGENGNLDLEELEAAWNYYTTECFSYFLHLTDIDSFKRDSEELDILTLVKVHKEYFLKYNNLVGNKHLYLKPTEDEEPLTDKEREDRDVDKLMLAMCIKNDRHPLTNTIRGMDEAVDDDIDFSSKLKALCESDPETFEAGSGFEMIKHKLEKIDYEVNIFSSTTELFLLIEALMHADADLDVVERHLYELILIKPELSLEIMKVKVECFKMVDEKWKLCSEEMAKNLVQQSYYEAFKASELPEVGEPDRNLFQLKRLVQKPGVEMVRSHEEFWNVLDFIYHRGDQEYTSVKRVTRKKASQENTVMMTILRPTIKPPISTSAVELFQLKSFREQRSSIPCVRSCRAAECDHNVLVFDGMIVEEDATPMGLGMEDGDIIGIIPRYDMLNIEEMDEIVESFGGLGLLQTIIFRTKRDRNQVSVGLNVVVGEKEGGLPLLKNQDLKHREELANLKTALLPALELTMEESQPGKGSKLPDSLPDFSSVREKLDAGVYTRASQGLKEVETILDRYERVAKMGPKAGVSPKEGKARLQLHKSLVQTMNEFHWAINGQIVTYIDAKQEAASALAPPEPDPSGPLVYLGPVRNATPDNFLASLPIVQFQGVSKEDSVEQLVDAWCHYTREQSKDLERPEYVMYNNKRCDLNVCIKDLGMVLEGLYFSLPLSYNALVEDDRDIEQLLEFIEGDDAKKEQGEKKKKKRKKKSGVDQSPGGEKSKESDKVNYYLVMRNVPSSSTFAIIQQELVDFYSAHGELEDLFSAHGTIEDVHPKNSTSWTIIATVTFKNKGALHRSAEAMKSSKAHLVPNHRLIVREALNPFLYAWREREVVLTKDYLTEEERKQLYWSLGAWGKATCDLLIRDVPPKCSNQDIVDLFSAFGRVEYIQIIRHRGWPKVATVTFTSSDAVLAALKAGRSKPFMLGCHKLVVEDGNKTDIAYANYMADCQLVVEEKRVLDAKKKSTEAAKRSLEIAKGGLEAAKGNPEAEKENPEATKLEKMRAAFSTNSSQVDLIAQLTDILDEEEPSSYDSQHLCIPSSSSASGVQKVSTEEGASVDEVTEGCSKAVVQDDQRTQIGEKEARLQETRDYLEYVVKIKGKKMADLITTMETIEDHKNKKLKEISVVEMKISDLQADVERLVREVKEADEQMISVALEKKDLETNIEKNISAAKKDIALLEEDLESLRIGVSHDSSKEDKSEPSPIKRKTNPNIQLLEYIDNKIKAKEKELECPVCLEVASAPIFMCSDLHLICSDCRPKVSICPECREPYPSKAKRHRYAEKAAEELAGFMEERAQVLNS